ncbi:hypothetical protein QJS04_geneDACA014676 [Acorus gramineus]|uniref:Uncharacterized protein n=1 Tax=Acorus gramineus TaxID=55184 RepID=A0AAV9B5V0_ACOGR|nr:hypothetical protein QJS04_geneDACA014676 [Acorus gramineus]
MMANRPFVLHRWSPSLRIEQGDSLLFLSGYNFLISLSICGVSLLEQNIKWDRYPPLSRCGHLGRNTHFFCVETNTIAGHSLPDTIVVEHDL